MIINKEKNNTEIEGHEKPRLRAQGLPNKRNKKKKKNFFSL
jgi:hypothetical protein